MSLENEFDNPKGQLLELGAQNASVIRCINFSTSNQPPFVCTISVHVGDPNEPPMVVSSEDSLTKKAAEKDAARKMLRSAPFAKALRPAAKTVNATLSAGPSTAVSLDVELIPESPSTSANTMKSCDLLDTSLENNKTTIDTDSLNRKPHSANVQQPAQVSILNFSFQFRCCLCC